MQRLTGIAVSPGVAVGGAVLLVLHAQVVRFPVPAARVSRELDRLARARERSRAQLEDIKTRVARSTGPDLAALFDAQLLMLDDPMVMGRAADLVRRERINAEWALQRAFENLTAVFDEIEDSYLRERKGDLADVVGRLRMNLRREGVSTTALFADLDEPCVLVADELTPSVAAQVDWSRIRGFATDAGSRTSHTAILARSLHVPAIVGLRSASARVVPGAMVVVDGTTGELLIDPDPALIEELRAREAEALEAPAQAGHALPAMTADGVRVRLDANVELPGDVAYARAHGAEGIGLYRTEFLLAGAAADGVSEDAQFAIYRAMVAEMAPDPVTIRTFDLDETHRPAGPAGGGRRADDGARVRAGLRGIRLSLARRDVFRTQLRALLRAARHGRLRILFPFVSDVEEVRAARGVVAEAAAELAARGQETPSVPVGVMIEVPSAAFTADRLADEADFLTIGTNDLIQYCLAVDRTDHRVSTLYEPLHPAILRLIRRVRRAAGHRGIPVSLCGEMAADPVLLTLLLGLGLTEFSMTPAAIPVARQVVRELRVDRLREIGARVLRLATVAEIEHYLLSALGGRGAAEPVRDEPFRA